MHINQLSREVIGCAIEVHKELGPGLLESAYERCLSHELNARGIQHFRQWPLPVIYKGLELDCSYRIDVFIERRLIVELKSTSSVERIHEAQMLTYMKLARTQVGLLLNFNVRVLTDGGVRRFVRGL